MVNVSVAIISQCLGFAYCACDYNEYITFFLAFFMFNCRCTAWCFLSWHPQSFIYFLSLYMLASFMSRFYFQSPFNNASGRVLCVCHWLDAPSPPSLHPADTPHRRSDTRESGAGPGGGRWRVACCLRVLLVWFMKRSSFSFSLCFSGKISTITIPHLKTSSDWLWRAWPTTSGVQFSLSKTPNSDFWTLSNERLVSVY